LNRKLLSLSKATVAAFAAVAAGAAVAAVAGLYVHVPGVLPLRKEDIHGHILSEGQPSLQCVTVVRECCHNSHHIPGC
jgi:hypothetical protein